MKNMPANEFEKNVQKVMDEFKLHPSAEVWQKVEERIQEKKKKRRILFFIIFSFVGLALAGYGIYNFSNKRMTSGGESVVAKKLTNQKNSIKTDFMQPEEPDAGNKSERDQEKLANQNQKGNGAVVTKGKISKSNNDIFISKRKYPVKDAFAKMNDKLNKDLNLDTTNSIVRDENISSGNESQVLKNELNQKIIADSVKKDVAVNNFADTVSIKTTENKISEEKEITKKEKNKSQHSQKIQWGINFSAGSSVITEDRFSFKNSNPQADLSYNSPNSYPGGALTRYPPSANQPVFAFKAGIAIRKEISPRSKLSAGLQYVYLGDRIKKATTQTQSGVQQSGSSALLSYYRAVPQKAYTDHFHFIELPLIYSWRINKNNKHFLSLNAGASIGYLLTANALTYDTSFGGIYFHDKSLFTRSHLNMESGISYHFAAAKKFEWSIGPQFSFDISKIIKSDVDKRKYFLYGGIDTKIFFEKKKK